MLVLPASRTLNLNIKWSLVVLRVHNCLHYLSRTLHSVFEHIKFLYQQLNQMRVIIADSIHVLIMIVDIEWLLTK